MADGKRRHNDDTRSRGDGSLCKHGHQGVLRNGRRYGARAMNGRNEPQCDGVDMPCYKTVLLPVLVTVRVQEFPLHIVTY